MIAIPEKYKDELADIMLKAYNLSNRNSGTSLDYMVYLKDENELGVDNPDWETEHFGIDEQLQNSWIEGRKYIITYNSGVERNDFTEDELDEFNNYYQEDVYNDIDNLVNIQWKER